MIRVFTAFSGYDSQCLALNVLRDDCIIRDYYPNGDTGWHIFDYELVGWSEIDKFAIQAHNALFPQWSDRNYGDISKIDWENVPDFDLFTYSSPCQDFSQAGKQKGGVKGSGTRSSLLWECERAIRIKKPKYLLFENVASIANKKNMPVFEKWQRTLEKMRYTNFWQILNAKTHGYPTPVPQNRKRVFMVSILNCEKPYIFPDPQPLATRLKDMLETNVPDCYYLSEERVKGVLASTRKEQERDNTQNYVVEKVAEIHPGQSGAIYSADGISPTICAAEGVKCNTIIAINTEDGVSRTIKAQYMQTSRANLERQDSMGATGVSDGLRIRKFTPRECFRLMGVRDEDIDKIQTAGISRTQQCHLAGNSIVVNCIAAVLKNLFEL